jgi:CheY-like chemotaxis protein
LARKILLADDSVTAQNMGRKILTDAGYEVVAVNNGSAALKKIAEHKPDLIVLDVYMPGYSGLEVCQRLKENRETARIPILLTVGKLEPFKSEEARRARADAFVVKPFEASELLNALTKLEEKIVAQPEAYKPGRFAKAVAAIEEVGSEPSEKFGDTDQGWKSRIRFPSRKSKAIEPQEPDDAMSAGRGGQHLAAEPSGTKTPAKTEAATSPETPTFERPMPAGLPQDITPEEITPTPAEVLEKPVKTVPAGPESSASIANSVEIPSLEARAPEPEVESESRDTEKETKTSAQEPTSFAGEAVVTPEPKDDTEAAGSAPSAEPAEESAPATFASTPLPEAEAKVEAEAPAVESTTATPFGNEAVATAAAIIESAPTESATAEATSAAEPTEPHAVEAEASPATGAPSIPATEAGSQLSLAPPSTDAVAAGLASEPAPTLRAGKEEPAPAAALSESTEGPKKVEEPTYSETPPPSSAPTAGQADDDFMAALQSLMPEVAGAAAIGPVVVESTASRGVDLTYVGTSETGPRWIAEEISLSVEESSGSLESEMEKAYAAFAASEAARLLASSVPETFPGTQPVVPSAQAPVPQQIKTVAGAEEVRSAVEPSPAVAEPAPAQVMASAAGAWGSADAASPASVTSAQPSSSTREEVVAAETPVSAAAASDIQISPDANEPAPAIAGEASPAEGTDDMDRKNSENLGFKMIRQSPAASSKGAGKAEPVSKESFEAPPAPAPEPGAMAAAASADSRPAAPAAPATDPKAIANIVDSVLAELRPKIVEEIAKKLSGEGK